MGKLSGKPVTPLYLRSSMLRRAVKYLIHHLQTTTGGRMVVGKTKHVC